ncbi:helix-turn-helix domain-containing protein [Devosia soli]|uniref:helix-turn-helix domain-containing protein n=1 Tax=Devosia soli TaxID=361041 RepID=UPI000A051F2D|nr:helix-turn-helix domain-containing protein [Devosia soli]
MTETRSWSWRHAVLKSDLPPTTRHVLLTISCFMNDVGGGCYPTQEQLAEASGLSDRAVRKHIDAAVEAGWLVKREHGFRGQKWRNHEYEASWPTQHLGEQYQDVDEGEELRSARFGEGAEPGSAKVRNHVPTILPDHPSNTSLRSEACERVSFDDVWSWFPQRPGANRTEAKREFSRLTDEETNRLVIAVKRFTQWHLEDSEARKVDPNAQLKFRPGLGKWIRTGAWVDFLHLPLRSDPVPPADNGLVVLKPDHPDFKAVEKMRGRPVILGKSGSATFRIEEIEQARASA